MAAMTLRGRNTDSLVMVRGRVVRQLDPFNAQVDTVSEPHVSRPDTAVTPQVYHHHTLQVGHAVRFGVL